MSHRSIKQLGHAVAHDRDGHKLGHVKEIYINNQTGEPDYVEVSHGLFGLRSSIVPLRGHTLEGTTLTLAFSKDLIKDAPHITKEEHLPKRRGEHDQICDYYGLEFVDDVHTYTDEPLDYSTGQFDDGHTTRGFGDGPLHGGSADRLRAISDHELGLDRTPEDRAMRGTSAHGMSDEPREYRRGLVGPDDPAPEGDVTDRRSVS